MILLQLVKKFPAFYGNRKFITTFTRIHQPALSRAKLLINNGLYYDFILDFSHVTFIKLAFVNKVPKRISRHSRDLQRTTPAYEDHNGSFFLLNSRVIN